MLSILVVVAHLKKKKKRVEGKGSATYLRMNYRLNILSVYFKLTHQVTKMPLYIFTNDTKSVSKLLSPRLFSDLIAS